MLVALVLLFPILAFGQQKITLAIVGGRLIDGYGGPPLEDSVILIEGNKIAAVGRVGELKVPEGVEVINSEGMTVMPGLIDMHVHFLVVGHNDYEFWFPYARTRSKELLRLSAKIILMQGVTTVKDCSGPLPDIVELRDAINRGEVAGPRAVVTGPFLQKTTTPDRDYVYWTVNGVEDARQKLKRLLEAGVDQIKIGQGAQLTKEELHFIVTEAHKAGKHITAHGTSPEEIRAMLGAGMDQYDTLEHVGGGVEPAFDEDIVKMLVRTRAGLVPTRIASEGMAQLEEFPEFRDNQKLKADLPPDIYSLVRKSYEDFQRHPLFLMGKLTREPSRKKLRQLKEAGARILMGTDSGTRGNPHELAAWREMEIMSEFGMTPMEIIMASTYWPAVNLRKDNEIGTIAPGKLADIIVIDGDPLKRITDVRNVVHIVKNGVQYK